jgi:hypothetical protein
MLLNLETFDWRRRRGLSANGRGGPGFAILVKGLPGEIISYCAGHKTAPNRPNSGSDAVKVAATSQKTHGEIFRLAENFRGP